MPSAAVVIAEDGQGRVMALDYRGVYRLPGGQVNYREDPEEAARREFREETGLEVEIEELVDATLSRGTAATLIVYRGSVEAGETVAGWEGEPVFLEKQEAGNKDWDRDFAGIVDEYLYPESRA